MPYLLVAVGSAIGGMLRFGIADILWGWKAEDPFAAGTWVVNLVGSFMVAFVNTAAGRGASVSPDVRIFITTGICGGFTTYSAFNWQAGSLLATRPWAGGAYIGATVIGGLLAYAAGCSLARAIA